jgi:hypothetical protein
MIVIFVTSHLAETMTPDGTISIAARIWFLARASTVIWNVLSLQTALPAAQPLDQAH